jgi:hypothetical protein
MEIVVCSNDPLNRPQPIPSVSRRVGRAWMTRDLSLDAYQRTLDAAIIRRLASNAVKRERAPLTEVGHGEIL